MQTLEEMSAHYKAVKMRLQNGAQKNEPPIMIMPEPEPKPEPEIKIHVDPKYPPLPISRPLKILRDVAERHGVTVGDIKGVSRKIKFVRARQEACYLLREELKLSYPRVAAHIGNRDHTTILHNVRKYKKTRLQEAG